MTMSGPRLFEPLTVGGGKIKYFIHLVFNEKSYEVIFIQEMLVESGATNHGSITYFGYGYTFKFLF